MKLKKYSHIIFAVMSCIWTGFIWSNSLKNATASGASSVGVTSWINGFLSNISPELVLSEHFIRKAAHFTEFAILGILLALSVTRVKFKARNAIAFLTSLSVACADELLQLFSEGRACSITDVCIDFSGAVIGIWFVTIILFVIKRHPNKSSLKKPLKPAFSENHSGTMR